MKIRTAIHNLRAKRERGRLTDWLAVQRRKLPSKPKRVDRFAQARRKRNKHIGRRAARRMSFRAYWREHGASYLENWPSLTRRERRRVALIRWRLDRHAL